MVLRECDVLKVRQGLQRECVFFDVFYISHKLLVGLVCLTKIKSHQYKPRPHTCSTFSVSVLVCCCQFVRLDLGDRCCTLSTHKLYYADVSCLLSFYVVCLR